MQFHPKLEAYLVAQKPYYETTWQRHERDLKAVKEGKKPHLRYNEKMGRVYVAILESFKHYKGKWAGEPFLLSDWQKKAVSICFGWEEWNEEEQRWLRRFGESIWHLPKKNGKTILGSGLTITDTLIRGEVRGEVYAFATKKDQADLAFEGIRLLLESHPTFSEHFSEAYSTITLESILKRELLCHGTFFKKLGKDSKGFGVDGISATFSLADEKHAHPNKTVEENVVSSSASRLQPHHMSISTAGLDVMSPYYVDYEIAKKVVEGVIENDNLFVFIAEPPPKPNGDEYHNFYYHPIVWELANPNYGISITKSFMQKQAQKTITHPQTYTSFLVKRLNKWTNAEETFISLDAWDKCKGEIDTSGELVRGLDLSILDDFTSDMEVYKVGKYYHIKSNFYLPKEGLREREAELRVNLTTWVRQGYITLTEGKSINYIYIYNNIIKKLKRTKAICYDIYKAKSLIKLIEEPLDQSLLLEFGEDLDLNNLEQYNSTYDDCIPITQGFAMLSEPTIKFRNLVNEGLIVHDGNPVLKWMISNITTVKSPQGNIMLSKNPQRREKKIDGVAGIMNAMALFLHKDEQKEEDRYSDGRGFTMF